jgi:hypothetical protein
MAKKLPSKVSSPKFSRELRPGTMEIRSGTDPDTHQFCASYCHRPSLETLEFFEGADQCKKEIKPSAACYFAVALLYVGLVLSLVLVLACLVNLNNKPSAKEALLLVGSLVLAYVSFTCATLMQTHCSNCNGLVGLGKVLLILLGYAGIVSLIYFGTKLLQALTSN